MGLVLPRLSVIAWLFASPLFAGENPERRLAGGEAFPEAGRPLDWVLEKVQSGNDEWSLEKVHDQVNARLKEMAAAVTGPEALRRFDEKAANLILSAEFRCPGLAPERLEPIRCASLEVERGETPESVAGAAPLPPMS